RAEAFASKNKPIPAAIDGLAMGLGFTFALAILSSVREILGAGTIYGIPLFGENFQPATLMIMPAVGFLALGVVIAAFQKILRKGVYVMSFTEIFSLAITAILIENFIFVKFLGCCPFLGVSKKMDTALGMGLAVIFVMTVASAVTYVVNEYILVKLNIEYMQT